MSFIKIGQENSSPIEACYVDQDSRIAGCAHPWLASQWQRMGKAESCWITWTRAEEINANLEEFLG